MLIVNLDICSIFSQSAVKIQLLKSVNQEKKKKRIEKTNFFKELKKKKKSKYCKKPCKICQIWGKIFYIYIYLNPLFIL